MLRVKNFFNVFPKQIFSWSLTELARHFPKILDQSVNMQRLGFVENSNCSIISNKIYENGAGRNASGRLFDQYQWKIRLHYLDMRTRQIKMLSHRRAKKNAPSWLFYQCQIRKILFSRSGRKNKTKKTSLPHDFFSCCEIRNKDIFKAGLDIASIYIEKGI